MPSSVNRSISRLPASLQSRAVLQPCPGLYAWWLAELGALPGVPTSPHPTEPLGLVYIGIAPRDAGSAQTIRTRILQKHLGSGLSGSTLRRALSAFLWRPRHWHPCMTPGGKLALPPEESAALTSWMERHLRVTWRAVAEPWSFERTLVTAMAPPLNSDYNRTHPFFPTMRATRARLTAAAGTKGPCSGGS